MSYQIRNAASMADYNSVFSKMNEIFGEQDHLSVEILEYIKLNYPGFFQIMLEQDVHKGHILFLPLNEVGYERMISPLFSEKDMKLEDLFHRFYDSKMYLFVYSIFSENPKLTKQLIKSTVDTAKNILDSVDYESIIFAEVVSHKGSLLAERLTLKHYHSYDYYGEGINLYKSTIENYVASFN